MDRIDGELRACGMAYGAALSQRVGIRQEVGRLRLRRMAAAASGGDRLIRVNPALLINHRIESGRQILFAAVNVAQRAILHIGRRAGWAHGREEHTGEVVHASAVPDHDVGVLGAIGCGIDAIVQAVDHQIKVDSLRRFSGVWRRPAGTSAGIRVRWVMAQNTILGIVPQPAV